MRTRRKGDMAKRLATLWVKADESERARFLDFTKRGEVAFQRVPENDLERLEFPPRVVAFVLERWLGPQAFDLLQAAGDEIVSDKRRGRTRQYDWASVIAWLKAHPETWPLIDAFLTEVEAGQHYCPSWKIGSSKLWAEYEGRFFLSVVKGETENKEVEGEKQEEPA